MSADIIQGSPEWKAIRLGKLTASRMADAVAKTKTGYGASRANLMAALIVERLTGEPTETYVNAAMVWGSEKESEACAAYAFHADADLAEVGFVDHPTIAMSGASPDRLIGEDGLLETKCPQSAAHLDTLLGGSVPGRYITQIQFQLACTGRRWCDFVSYDPRFSADMQLFIRRVERDDAFIAELEREAVEFLAELDEKMGRLTAAYRRTA